MTDWKTQYLAALEARDEADKEQFRLYDYCSRVADNKARLEKKLAAEAAQASAPPSTLTPPQPLFGYGIPRFTSSPPAQESHAIIQLRQDLSKAQVERDDLQAKLQVALREVGILDTKAKSDSKKIAQLSAAVQQLTTKIRDREEELKGKAKLVQNVQDENVTLNLQLNVAEEQADRLKKENQELVDRWMARMGQEADQMNRQSRFG